MELGRATDNQLAVLGGLTENMTRRVDALERLSGTIEGRMVAFTEQKAEIDRWRSTSVAFRNSRTLSAFSSALCRNSGNPTPSSTVCQPNRRSILLTNTVSEPIGGAEVPELVTVRPPAVDLPAATRENRTRRWRRFATNLRAASGRLERHRIRWPRSSAYSLSSRVSRSFRRDADRSSSAPIPRGSLRLRAALHRTPRSVPRLRHS